MATTILSHLPGACERYPHGNPLMIGDPTLRKAALAAAEDVKARCKESGPEALTSWTAVFPSEPRNAPPPVEAVAPPMRTNYRFLDVKGYEPPAPVVMARPVPTAAVATQAPQSLHEDYLVIPQSVATSRPR